MLQQEPTGSQPVVSMPSDLHKQAAVAAFLVAKSLRDTDYRPPAQVILFIERFNQEQYGVAVAHPWSQCRLVEIYSMDLRLLCQIPYELIQDEPVKVLDSMAELYGRGRYVMVNLCKPLG